MSPLAHARDASTAASLTGGIVDTAAERRGPLFEQGGEVESEDTRDNKAMISDRVQPRGLPDAKGRSHRGDPEVSEEGVATSLLSKPGNRPVLKAEAAVSP